jgi:hypothetical protein
VLVIIAVITMLMLFATASSADTVDVLTQHDDAQRTGTNLHETELKPSSVANGGLHRLFEWRVDGQIYGQALYVSQFNYNGRKLNMIIVATMNNSVYAFEAPARGSVAKPSDQPLWRVDSHILGTPLLFSSVAPEGFVLGYNIYPYIGATSTPVIDREKGLVYVTTKSCQSAFVQDCHPNLMLNRIFAIDLSTGKLKYPPTNMIDSKRMLLDPEHHLQRAALLEANGRIYDAF